MLNETGTIEARRIFVEKHRGHDIEAQFLYGDLTENLGICGLEAVRVVNRYDIFGIMPDDYILSRSIVFADSTVDLIYDEYLPLKGKERVFAVEYLPGQFDQRADSAAQCLQVLTRRKRPKVNFARVIVLEGKVTDEDFARVKAYCINPVESREASLGKQQKAPAEAKTPPDVELLEGFNSKSAAALLDFMKTRGLAMSLEDLLFCQAYFRDREKREPTITEIKVLDTYWSDHCRHTTFLTKMEGIKIDEGPFTAPLREAFQEYLSSRKYVYGDQEKEKDICLMDIALLAMRELRKKGFLDDLDESEEINACSIVVKADVDGKEEEWLVMFKNETHNHPTEIEPFGGAATCLGGAIRDPLSGRAYVYQAMRVTGCADPRGRVPDTLPGKLPQRKITAGAAEGYSTYGNQIGVAAGPVTEFYDEGFLAKRMEVGAVIGAVPRENVIRKKPVAGDVVILIGGRTGRDGIGGATGSSREHTAESLSTAGAEVQKGNPPEERKIQRLFRRAAASTMIKKCNDFGAGGVSVAIGELADGLDIKLDAVPQKYSGLDGTELAISESQERMAVVVAPADVRPFCHLAAEENLEATPVARVTGSGRLRMFWRGRPIVDLSRDFLDSNGVKQKTAVVVTAPEKEHNYFRSVPEAVAEALPDLKKAWLANLQDLNICSQKGLQERFDGSSGAATVLMPLGGIYQETPAGGMVATLPLLSGETNTATLMTFGYSPRMAWWSPFHGALYAVVEAVAGAVARGGDYQGIRLTFQEYFEKLGEDASRWGKPFAALLGAFLVQKKLGIPAIGGKDSMSGTFMDLHVPPTLIAFAVNTIDARRVVSPEFKETGSRVVLVALPRDKNERPDFSVMQKNFSTIAGLARSGALLAAHVVGFGGLAAAISKMAFGNRIGMVFNENIDLTRLFSPDHGSFILEIDKKIDLGNSFGSAEYKLLGHTQEKEVISLNSLEISLAEALSAWHSPLEKIFPAKKEFFTPVPASSYPYFQKRKEQREKAAAAAPALRGRPRVLIPVFPGTSGEYDAARAFEEAGGKTEILIIRNLTVPALEQSIKELAKRIAQSQIIMLPGGSSAGDEPDGSGKFIATLFRNPRIGEALTDFLEKRGGLMLGLGNGFQALVRLGLLPFGEITDPDEKRAVLTVNTIGRHVSRLVRTKIISNLSPWFGNVEPGDIQILPISCKEGRFVAGKETIAALFAAGQVAARYVDFDGNPSNAIEFNPGGSGEAIESVSSPDGRILGKMGHPERFGAHAALNVPGEKGRHLFDAGINYFR